MGELETEAQRSRAEIATSLREFADQLDGGDPVTLELGGQKVSLDPENPVTFKLEGESDWADGDAQAKQSIEFELVWWTDVQSADEARLTVESTEP
ncbi:amphi-Trp domain-containing protein [Halobacteriales archaeon Cl-PHB]